MRIALFDLDKTLLARNSAALWLKHEFRAGRVPWHQAALATAWLLRYRRGSGQLAEPLRRTFGALKGVPLAAFRSHTQAFYHGVVRPEYRVGALQAHARHRAAGDQVVLLSSTHHLLAEAVACDLPFDALLCNRLAVDDQGVLTGETQGPLCFGEGKLHALKALAAQRGFTLADCVFYTDSMSDVSVLEAVGQPVLVNPDRALKRHGRRRGWPEHVWGGRAGWPWPQKA